MFMGLLLLVAEPSTGHGNWIVITGVSEQLAVPKGRIDGRFDPTRA
jgi:hypothetical protein